MQGRSLRRVSSSPRPTLRRSLQEAGASYLGATPGTHSISRIAPVALYSGVIDRALDQANVAVAEQEMSSAAVLAEELIDVALRVARPVPLPRVTQEHARAVLMPTGPTTIVLPSWTPESSDRSQTVRDQWWVSRGRGPHPRVGRAQYRNDKTGKDLGSPGRRNLGRRPTARTRVTRKCHNSRCHPGKSGDPSSAFGGVLRSLKSLIFQGLHEVTKNRCHGGKILIL
jgi:hypothetical protein